MDRALIERIVAEVVRRLRAREAGREVDAGGDAPVRLVTEELVRGAAAGGRGEVRAAPGAVVTPLARDALRETGVRLVAVRGAGGEEARAGGAIAVGADVRGQGLLSALRGVLAGTGREVVDCGGGAGQAGGYVAVAEQVALAVAEGRCGTGIVVDGGGGPSAIAANKVAGVRAVACQDVTAAKFARAHVDANVLCLGAGAVGDTVVQEIVATWLSTPFAGGEYTARVRAIAAVERRRKGQ